MSVEPGIYNFEVRRRADFSVLLQFKDGDGDPIVLTGYTVDAEVWDEYGNKKYADFGIDYTDRLNGQVTISLSDTDTAGFPDESYYDVLLIDPSGQRNYYLKGKITATQGYTT